MEQLPEMTIKQLREKLSRGNYVLEFMADWCPDCSFIKPALPEIEAAFPDYHFIQVDRDQNIGLAQELNIFGIPSFLVYQDGREQDRLVNKDRKTKDEVIEFIQQAITK